MAERIRMELLQQNVVALPVHDSFLVPASKKAALEQAIMRVAYQFGLNEIRIGDEMVQIGEG